LELVVFGGKTPLEVVQRYNLYSGGGALPPLWGLGFWHRMHAHADADAVYAELAEFKKQDIPLDVLGLEPGWMTRSYPCSFEWQTKRFPDPKGFTEELLNEGIHLNLWINPYVSQYGRLHEPLYPLSGSHMVWLGIVPDFRLSETREIFAEFFRKEHFGFGVSGYKADEVDGYDRWLWPDHATFPSGTSGEAMRQTYGMQLQKTLYSDLFRSENRRSYSLVRASSGAASAFPFVLYSDSYDHEEYITGISAASLAGLLWTPEIRQASDAREWLNRMQTVCFSHMAMLNAWASGTKPWSFPEVTDSIREVIELRMRLLPYLYTAFADYHFEGVPPIRAMVLEDGDFQSRGAIEAGELDGVTNPYEVDRVFEKNDQFMLGPDILVAPFYGPKYATVREVALPTGDWYDFYSGAYAGNGEIIQVDAETLGNRIPLFVRGGAIIPMLKEAADNAKEVTGAPLVLRHYGQGGGSVRIYEDDAMTFDYLSGGYRFRDIQVSEDGSFDESIRGSGPALYGAIKSVEKMTDSQK
jgi:alpha-D-xyloside xylohydrolase